jgi:hypothetical protein
VKITKITLETVDKKNGCVYNYNGSFCGRINPINSRKKLEIQTG